MATISLLHSITGKLLGGVVCCLILCSCTSTSVTTTTDRFPPLQEIETKPISDEDILALSPQMKQFVADHVSRKGGKQRRLRALIWALNKNFGQPFQYNDDLTLTAADAFAQQQGNCLAFSNMVVALAREAGLKARYQEVKVPPTWDRQGEANILMQHVNVVLHLSQTEHVVDVNQRRILYSDAPAKEISDATAKALYYNNLGTDALLTKNLGAAYSYFVAAIERDPTIGYLWSNLGVAYIRNNQAGDAEWAYRQAIRLDSSALTAVNNLAALYTKQGKTEQARALQAKSERFRRNNPYYLLQLSEAALTKQRYDEALKILRRALRKKNDEYRLHFAMAKSLYLIGRYDKAESSYQRAKQLAPEAILESEYNRPLNELVLQGS